MVVFRFYVFIYKKLVFMFYTVSFVFDGRAALLGVHSQHDQAKWSPGHYLAKRKKEKNKQLKSYDNLSSYTLLQYY